MALARVMIVMVVTMRRLGLLELYYGDSHNLRNWLGG
jgi:hypothetical protein